MADPLLLGLLDDARAFEASLSSPSGVPEAPRDGGVPLMNIGTSLNAKVFSVVKVDCADSRVCFGKIGAGTSTFCVRTGCTTKSHGESKMPFRGTPAVYMCISQVPGITAFIQPTIRESQMPAGLWDEWRTLQLSLTGWRREFQAVESNDNAVATMEDIKKETTFLDTADTFRTPAKRKRGGDEEDNPRLLGELKSVRYVRFLPTEEEEMAKVKEFGLGRGVLTDVVARLETSMISMNEGLEELVILTTNRFRANEDDMKMISGMVGNVRASIGDIVEMDTLFAAPTMWGTISSMADELLKVGARVKESIDAYVPFRTTVGTRLDDIKTGADTTVKIIGMLMKTIKSLTADNEVVKEIMEDFRVRLVAINNAQRGSKRVKRHGDDRNHTVDDLMDMLSDNSITPEKSASMDEDEMSDGRTDTRRTNNEGTNDDSIHPMLTQESLNKFIQVIEDVSVLKIASEASAIKFGNLGMRNLQECTKWVDSNFSDHRYGLIVDPLIMLDRIFGDDEVDPNTQLKTLESRLKLNIETGSEASSITSLSHSRPRIFHTGRPTMSCDQHSSRLNKLCKHSKWKTGGEGVRNYIVRQMNVLRASIASDILFTYGHDPDHSKAQVVATLSLTASVAFLTQLLNYIDELFEKLHVYSKFTVETGWSLSMQVLDRIVADLFAPKEGVANGMKGDRRSICSNILWSSFRSHDIAQVYLDHNFENHPAISSEFIKFLATNSGFEKVEKLQDHVDLLKAKVTAAVAETGKAERKADTASQKSAEAVRDVLALARRVKTLEDRR